MNTFKSKERLKHRKKILEIFANGKSMTEFPIQVVYSTHSETEQPEIQAGFSAPKKHFKLAVDRNRRKRLMREAYRLNKQQLVNEATQLNTSVYMMFIYKTQSKLNFNEVEQKISLLLNRLCNNLTDPKPNKTIEEK
mgnify:CR=1 FL=1